MDLLEYFENTEGVGVLGTADKNGVVDMAIYARPHVMDDGTIAFIMADRLSYRNISENGKAAYLFIEKGQGYKGLRLYLTKMGQETDSAKIAAIRRSGHGNYAAEGSERYLVYFKIDRQRPLVGD